MRNRWPSMKKVELCIELLAFEIVSRLSMFSDTKGGHGPHVIKPGSLCNSLPEESMNLEIPSNSLKTFTMKFQILS